MDNTDTVWLAEYETRSYSFRALGKDEADALRKMWATWNTHCAEMKERGHEVMLQFVQEDVHITELAVGWGYRDDIRILPKRPKGARHKKPVEAMPESGVDEHGRAWVRRFVITHINKDGVRTLTTACQGRHTTATRDESEEQKANMLKHTPRKDLEQVFGKQCIGTFQVWPCHCYPEHFDPLGVFFK